MTINNDRVQPALRGTARRPSSPTHTPVMLISAAVAAVSAFLLTMVVFPGETEAVITGSLVASSGLGWATLGVLSRRTTDEPQPWTRVPAVATTVAGVALIVFAPQHATLAKLGWVWPPLMIALVVWMVVKSRRALPRRPRRLLLGTFVALGLTAIGASVHDVTALGVTSAPGDVYSVGDHSLHLDCRGAGSPTVVLFNGVGEFSGSWDRVFDGLGPTSRVCAYDRAGQGWSDDPAQPQDAVEAAEDLHALLAAAGEAGPYVLAGHSVGGPYALVYAERYPEDVAGMVLLDSTSPDQFSEVDAYGLQYELLSRGAAFMPVLARIGLVPALTPATRPEMAGQQGGDAMTSTVRLHRNVRDDLAMVPTILEQAQSLSTIGNLPLAVVTATESLSMDGWDNVQARLALLSTDVSHVTIESSHAGLLYDAPGAAASVAAISSVVESVRSGASVSAS